ncbi:hypothetical protein Lsan_3829 [Legionella santicrucis]|uniref:Uncharacterized protein n=1 Tax=Legionella santicrucis TaxID=45074 RepID=A0A0W0Y8Z2_9GAMM|nr:hypothetical protein [Legionella santicrucis]KTD53419.1 hypothetical protein Lsan_3829 [Legionella santicrucis]
MAQEKQEGYKFENPKLFFTLPFSIVTSAFLGTKTPEDFHCPHRKALHEECSKVQGFDSYTVPPVNITLHHEKTPLTKESFQALKDDMHHTKSWKPTFSDEERVQFYREQSQHQTKISKSFFDAGEHEGAFMHSGLSKFFSFKAEAYDFGRRMGQQIDREMSGKEPPIISLSGLS